jgi:hypothetical protein
VPVPTNRFHLVSVDAEGRARLKLQPRYYLNAAQDVVRDDGPPTYDAPPNADDLLRDAARNHQFERAYQVERSEARTRRRDAEFEAHQKLAERSFPIRRFAHSNTRSRRRASAISRTVAGPSSSMQEEIATLPDKYRRKRTDASAKTIGVCFLRPRLSYETFTTGS